MFVFYSHVAAESDDLSVREVTRQGHGPGSFDWNKILRLGHKVVRSLQTLISLVGGVGADLTNPEDRRALAVREILMLDLKELNGLLELDNLLPNEISSISSPALPDHQLWLSLLELGRSLDDLSLRLKEGRPLDPKVSISLLQSNIDCQLVLLWFQVTDDDDADFSFSSPNRRSAARSRPRQTRRMGDDHDLIGLTEASQNYDIPKSVLSKAWRKREGSPGYLRCAETEGRRVYFYREDILNFWRSRKRLKH